MKQGDKVWVYVNGELSIGILSEFFHDVCWVELDKEYRLGLGGLHLKVATRRIYRRPDDVARLEAAVSSDETRLMGIAARLRNIRDYQRTPESQDL